MICTKWEYYAIRGQYGPEELEKAKKLRAKRRGMFLLVNALLFILAIFFCAVFSAALISKM